MWNSGESRRESSRFRHRAGRALIVTFAIALLVTASSPVASAADTRTVRGKVTYNGNPVVGAVVGLVPLDGGAARLFCTNANGVYRFTDVAVGGNYRLGVGPVSGGDPNDRNEGNTQCTNTDFKTPNGKSLLGYYHPTGTVQWPNPYPDFKLKMGSGDRVINMKVDSARHACFGFKATRVGTKGADVINGTKGPDVIVGKGGGDMIEARGGQDVVCGDAGSDTVLGGGGLDLIFGGAGNDTLKGGGGPDFLWGEGGKKDRLIGGPGFDSCIDNLFAELVCEGVGA